MEGCGMKKTIDILDYYDGFGLIYYEDDVEIRTVHIDHHDTCEALSEFFKAIGFDSKYQEVY